MNNFGTTLNTLRTARQLTVRQLANNAHVPASLISGLQTGNRIVGENNARKIGVALGLSNEELDGFVFLAINNAAGRVLTRYKGFPAEVQNLLASELLLEGIYPNNIAQCVRSKGAATVLYLTDGRKAAIDLKIACE